LALEEIDHSSNLSTARNKVAKFVFIMHLADDIEQTGKVDEEKAKDYAKELKVFGN
jgi:hypothetical protein